MQNIVYLIFLCIFVIDFLGKEKFIPRYATYMPEILSIGLLLAILFIGAKKKLLDISGTYWIILFFIALAILFGVLLNNVQATTVVAGIRTYFKYIPFFLLPAVFLFSSEQIQKQLQFLFVLTILQLPIALYQRFVISSHMITGDYVVGTLSISSHLSVYLICASSILLAFYIKKLITRRSFYLLLIIFLVPTTINETKGTLFLLPFAVMLPILFVDRLGEKLKRILLFGILGVFFLAIYIPIYDHFRAGERASIVDYFSSGKYETYLAPQMKGVDTDRRGRLDLIIIAVTELSNDFTQLMLGVGIGNISSSFLGEKFDGEYYKKFGNQFIGLSQLLWEIGILGTLFLFILWFKIALDARYVSRRHDQIGALALGWIGVIGVLFLSLTYKNFINVNLGYLFWFYSGYIASERIRMMRKSYDGLPTIRV